MNNYSSIINFLKKNGFKRMERNSYANDRCNVVIKNNDDGFGYDHYYVVADNKGWTVYSDNLNIYWLIGFLTYYGYMDKNYK